MFKNIFGNIPVKIPDELPGKRWTRLRKITLLTRNQIAEEGVNNLALARLENDRDLGVGIALVLKLATIYARLLKCTPLDVLEYVYPELTKVPGQGIRER
jgi:hypothetical protein